MVNDFSVFINAMVEGIQKFLLGVVCVQSTFATADAKYYLATLDDTVYWAPTAFLPLHMPVLRKILSSLLSPIFRDHKCVS